MSDLPTYTPTDWYWKVNNSTTQVYSSRVGNYIPVEDKTYVGWLSNGGIPTSIETEAALGDVLSQYSIRPVATSVLDGYKDDQARKITLEVVAKILFYLVNEIRGLKGQNPINANQFRNQVKELM